MAVIVTVIGMLVTAIAGYGTGRVNPGFWANFSLFITNLFMYVQGKKTA